MIEPGEVVVVEFPGVEGAKRRPAVVLSSELYHKSRPDIIIGLLTTRVNRATGPTDHVLSDWQAAGLDAPSAFRAFLATRPATEARVIGRLTPADWTAVRTCCLRALDLQFEMPDDGSDNE